MTNEILLEAEQICFSWNQSVVLQNVSFKLISGTCIAILGQSGAGKSTLLKILSGHLNPDSGAVKYRGVRLKDPREQLIRGHQEIQMVNQDFNLDLYHNVEENLRIKLPGYAEHVKATLIREVLDVVELSQFAKHQVQYLSGGEQQRLALARALIQEPDVLLLDEPFVHLDSGLRLKIERYIQNKLKTWNGSVLLVTHDGREAMTWANQIVYLNQGIVARQDTPENFYHQPSNLNEALHFGHINTIMIDGIQKMFRPNAYEIVQEKGIQLKKTSSRFLGTHYENWLSNESQDNILLYAQEQLPDVLSIQPYFVAEKKSN
jgi:ABC-type Fe3+/spermidine/putrescine transport system ATPase subunit